MKKLAVFASGGGSNFGALIDHIHEKHGEIAMLFVNKKEIGAIERATKADIPWAYIGKDRFTSIEDQDRFILQLLMEHEVELIVLAGYLGIISPSLVKAYPETIINIHPSLIPKYCGKGFYGLRVHEAVIANKEQETGVTIHYVDEGIDTGRILRQEKLMVAKEDDPISLSKRVLDLEHRLLVQTTKELLEEDE